MRVLRILSILMITVTIACGQQVQSTDMAVQAMERARAAEADLYAPQEYALAEDLFNQMQEAMNEGDDDLTATLVQSVVDAANTATDIARQNKATTLIAQLKQTLATAQRVGIDERNPEIYSQATQSLIDAENFYTIPDYEKAIELAQSGLDLLEPLIGGSEALALANLNRARELLDRAYKTTDLDQTEGPLAEASNIIEQASIEYQNGNYVDSIDSSQEAIDMIERLMAQYPGDGSISIMIDNEENLQLQAYDLIRRLGKAIDFIKTNNYTQSVYTDSSRNAVPLTPLTPATLMQEQLTNTSLEEMTVDDATELTNDEDIGIFLYEEDEDIDEVEIITLAPLYSISIDLKAQDINLEVQRYDPSASLDNIEVITVDLIERFHESAQQYYNEGNYLNAVDQAREGLRLSDLYLAGQTLKNHRVIKGDTLWDIAGETYNRNYWLWPNIWRANKLIIKDPDLIYPKQEFRIPPAPVSE